MHATLFCHAPSRPGRRQLHERLTDARAEAKTAPNITASTDARRPNSGARLGSLRRQLLESTLGVGKTTDNTDRGQGSSLSAALFICSTTWTASNGNSNARRGAAKRKTTGLSVRSSRSLAQQLFFVESRRPCRHDAVGRLFGDCRPQEPAADLPAQLVAEQTTRDKAVTDTPAWQRPPESDRRSCPMVNASARP